MDRSKLHFRKNVEGYFFKDKGDILAKKTSFGVVFPGGGVDEGEDLKEALLRETYEETGAIVKNIKKIDSLRFIWSEDWAHTEKQKKRFEEFQGEDMTFFIGKIDIIEMPKKRHEDYWGSDLFLSVEEVLEILQKKFIKNKDVYTKKQIELIRKNH